MPRRFVLRVRADAERFGLHEIEVENATSYTNPFDPAEISLDVTVTDPDGQEYSTWGYFDGDGVGGQSGSVWKIRLMPRKVGTYAYTYAWSGTGTKPSGDSGSFTCEDSGQYAGPLTAHSGGRWFTDGRGAAVWPQMLYYHEMLFQSTWQTLVDTHVVGNEYLGCGFLFWQADGLATNGWDNGSYDTEPQFHPMLGGAADPDYTRYDLASLARMDTRIQYLQAAGLYWYNFDGLYPNVGGSFPEVIATEEAWARYYLARFGAYWSCASVAEAFEWYEFQTSAVMRRRSAAIASYNAHGLLVSVHDTLKTDAAGAVSINNNAEVGSNGLSLNSLHQLDGTAGTAAAGNAGALACQSGFPVLSLEGQWEGSAKLTADQVRKGAWGAVMGGAALHLYGEFDIGQVAVGPVGAGSAHASNLHRQTFLASLGDDLLGLAPNNASTNSGNYCLREAAVRYLVYAPAGGDVDVDLSAETGTWTYDWFNPRDGTTATGGSTTGGASRTLSAPDTNDWVLHARP